jgi:hypothetical protein
MQDTLNVEVKCDEIKRMTNQVETLHKFILTLQSKSISIKWELLPQ